jgi:hypothetical protein
MADPPEDPPRRGLSPAAWTALSAIAVAVIGAVVTLTTTWWQHAPASTAKPAEAPPAAAASMTPTTSRVDPSAWAGAWKGTARGPDGQTFEVRVRLDGHCLAGAVCGSISVPHVPCTGHLTFVSATPDGAEFSVDDFDAASDHKVCQPGAGEVLKERADGDLEYHATYSGARGLLYRVD